MKKYKNAKKLNEDMKKRKIKKGETIVLDEASEMNFPKFGCQLIAFNKKREEETLKWAKDFDKRNRYWLNVFKVMPEGLQKEIMFGSCFVSNGVMLWICAGMNQGEIKKRSEIISYYEDLYKKKEKKK